MADVPQRDWKKYCEESNGRSILIPEKFIPLVKEWNDARVKLNNFINELAEKENHTTHKFRGVVYEIQKFLSENGKPGIWTMDIGFDMNALAEGIFVLNITENMKQ